MLFVIFVGPTLVYPRNSALQTRQTDRYALCKYHWHGVHEAALRMPIFHAVGIPGSALEKSSYRKFPERSTLCSQTPSLLAVDRLKNRPTLVVCLLLAGELLREN